MFFQALSRLFKNQLEGLASGTTVPIVNKSKFNSVRIGLPPIHEQGPIVDSLETLRVETQRLESIYQQKLAALDELKKSLLHQAFSGSL
jgi:type I restriction enzyme, S subunit